MKVIKIIGVIVLLIVLALIIAIYHLPSRAHMERSILIEASPEEVYRELSSYRNFNTWSPWAMKDSAARFLFKGPKLGPGTKIIWQSDHPDVGSGSMEILNMVENRKVTSLMQFDGYDGKPKASFILTPVMQGTKLTWTYDEKDVSGISKIYLLGIDGFLGEDYEKGLQKIKHRIESAPDFDYPVSLQNNHGFTYVGLKDSSLNDPSLMASKMAQNYGELMGLLGNRGVEITGNPVAFFDIYNEQEEIEFTCALPVKAPVDFDKGRAFSAKSPEGLVIKLDYTGGYNNLQNVYDEIKKFAAFYNYKLTGNPWEEYLAHQGNEPDTSRQNVHIYYPVE